MSAAPHAILFLHGLTGSPQELAPVIEAAQRLGAEIEAPHLVGHGTRPDLLANTRFSDWLASARFAFDRLSARHERVHLVGLSMGALCALALAYERGARVGRLVCMATPLQLPRFDRWGLKLAQRLPLATFYPYSIKRTGPDLRDRTALAETASYDRMPIAAAQSLLDAQQRVRRLLPLLSCPTLVQHGRHDSVAPPRNLDLLFDALRMPIRQRILYARSAHILPLDYDREAVATDALGFLGLHPRPSLEQPRRCTQPLPPAA